VHFPASLSCLLRREDDGEVEVVAAVMAEMEMTWRLVGLTA
jgi:hypothetical protein